MSSKKNCGKSSCKLDFLAGFGKMDIMTEKNKRRTQFDLRERVKELTCLYGIGQAAQMPETPLEDMLMLIVKLLPPAMQYPEIACARITLDKRHFSTPGFRKSSQLLSANIIVNEKKRGIIEVIYTGKKIDFGNNAFLIEEQHLLDTVARHVALIAERKESEEEKRKLAEQLRHADRLATIGQLSAGVAHELNEPIGGILGFAQLAKKCPNLPEQAGKDIEKIVAASLHAREIVKKLMLFSRQMPAKKMQVNLTQIVEEGLYFLESRCAKEGIELIRAFSPFLPVITADPGQLHQILVNLIVNAIQAMPGGGRLTIKTSADKDTVSLIVEDTGTGMDENTARQIFIPFFTTKDIGQGTGLGLPVVHGIVTSHGGTINVESKPGEGSKFEIKLPICVKTEKGEPKDEN